MNKVSLQFLGTGSAFTLSNYQSNAILTVTDEKGVDHHLLIDAGTDIRRSLHETNIAPTSIEGLYVSHLHADHSGGVGDLALLNFFVKQNLSQVMKTGETDDSKKPFLYGVGTMLKDGWDKCWRGGLETLELLEASLQDYFRVRPIKKNKSFTFHGLEIHPFQTIHVMNGLATQDSYGLKFVCPDGTRILLTTDTQFCPNQLHRFYDWADFIAQDCETSAFKSGVHAHYDDLKTLPDETKAKMWLFHYQDGELPNAEADGFAGFIKKGQNFVWEVPVEDRAKVLVKSD